MLPLPLETTVAIVEEDEPIREGWARALEELGGYRVTGKFGSGEEALAGIPKSPPDFVLMDITLPGMSGIECTRELKRQVPYVEVLMFTMLCDLDGILDALRAGANGYLLKRTSPTALKAAMEEVRIGGVPMSPYVVRLLVEHVRRPTGGNLVSEEIPRRVEHLSPKETEILKLLTAGSPYKEIAEKLEIHIDTVRTHIRRAYRKLRVHSRTDAAIKYRELQSEKEDKSPERGR